MVFGCTLEVCLVIWMQYKSICENLTNMLLVHYICIHFQGHLPIYALIRIQHAFIKLWCKIQ
jgi:hypothetical protein